MKKTFKELKREARAALKGKWGEAALAIFAYFIIIIVLEGGMSIFQLLDHDFMHRYEAFILQGNPEAAISFLAGSMWKYSAGAILFFLFVGAPLVVGLFNTFLWLLRGNKNIVDNMFKLGFKPYWRSVLGYFLMIVKIYLWMLLLIIPGIIKAFAYALTPYILKDNPELSCLEAIERSRLMMKGNKWRLFVLYLSFIGWFLLGLLTLGIGYFWLAPYVYTTTAAFYEDIKSRYEAAA